MIGRHLLLSLIMVGLGYNLACAIDPEYHDLDEIYEKLVAWQVSYPEIMRVDTIGWSQQDSLPIWAVKLSYNVDQDEDKPTILFVGNIHAEELIGTEIIMAMMDTILVHNAQISPYFEWLYSLEIWFIPTLNPEGHQVVMDELDISFRKNKRDCDLDDIFDYVPGRGGDIDGVDLNRNYPLHWVHGDGFLDPSGNEPFDYFRGFTPLSESESIALWEFGKREKISFSIVWHSSRSGNYSERIYYPWEWPGNKTPPDFEAIQSVAIEMASQMHTSTGTYPAYASEGLNGNQHNSFYAFLGTFSYLIEAGPGIQSSYSIAEQVIESNIEGAYHLLYQTAGNGETGPNEPNYYPQLTGTVKDLQTGSPLEAIVIIQELDSPYLSPRTCEPTYGRYRRYLMAGTYNIEIRKRNYIPQVISNVVVNPSGARTLDVLLEPKPVYSFNGQVKALNGAGMACKLYIQGEDVDDILNIGADGQFNHSLPEGTYDLLFDSPGYVVRSEQIVLEASRYIEFELPPGDIIFSDNFESGLSLWDADGTDPDLVRWDTEDSDSLWNGGMVASDSPLSDYYPLVENWIELSDPIDLSGEATASLRFQHWYYFEIGADSCFVEVSIDGGSSWVMVAGPFWGQGIGWAPGLVSLDPYCELDDVRLRFKIKTDSDINEQGWSIDDVEIMTADTLLSGEPEIPIPVEYPVFSIYPNPFNSQLVFLAQLPGAQHIAVAVWDLSGRKVAEIFDGTLSAGSNRLNWKTPQTLATGIYFIRVQADRSPKIFKIIYLK